MQDEVPLLRKLLAGVVKPYLKNNPTALAALELIRKQDKGPICYDHFAFRTFGVTSQPSLFFQSRLFSSWGILRLEMLKTDEIGVAPVYGPIRGKALSCSTAESRTIGFERSQLLIVELVG